MGDSFQKFAAPDVLRGNAATVAKAIEDWLLQAGVAALPKSDNVLGADLGFPPGENADQYLAPTPASMPSAVWVVPRTLWTNGIEVSAEPKAYHWMQGFPEVFNAICPKCTSPTPAETFMEGFGDAYDQWLQDENRGFLCASCDVESALSGWRTDEDCLQASNFGITIWNWPELSEQFVARISDLAESEIVYLPGKL